METGPIPLEKFEPAQPEHTESRWEYNIDFRDHAVPLSINLKETAGGNLTETIELGTKIVAIEYTKSSDNWRASLLTIKDPEKKSLQIELSSLDPKVETQYQTSDEKHQLSLFVTHPDMDPKKMFGGQAKYEGRFAPRKKQDEQWVVSFDGEATGFTIPVSLKKEEVRSSAKQNQVPVKQQLFVLPNEGLIPDDVTGFHAASVPFVISNEISSIPPHPDGHRHIIMTSQRSGHAKVVAGMQQEAAQKIKNHKMPDDSASAYYVPTADVLRLTGHIEKTYGVSPSSIHGWCYVPEKGYGGDRLPLDPTDPLSAKTMLAFLSLNSELTREILQHASQRPIIYTDTKQDMVFYNLLTESMRIPLTVVTKTYRHLDQFDGNLGGKMTDIIHRTARAIDDVPHILQKWDLPPTAPDGAEFMLQKFAAAFGRGISLYSTDARNARIPRKIGTTDVVAIPLVFTGTKSDTEDLYERGSLARERLANQITRLQEMEHTAVNIPPETISRIKNSDASETPIISLQLGSSFNLFTDEAIRLLIEVAKDERVQNSVIMLTGYREKELYLAELGRILGVETEDISYNMLVEAIQTAMKNRPHPKALITLPDEIAGALRRVEETLPPNVVVFGMRRDIKKLGKATDVLITTSTIGNLYDGAACGTALITLGPDTVTLNDAEKLQALATAHGKEQARDGVAIMAETAIERTGDVGMIIDAYLKAGLPADSAILPITNGSTVEEAVETIFYALKHQEEMANALGSIHFETAEYLFTLLSILAKGGSSRSLREHIAKTKPDFAELVARATTDPMTIDQVREMMRNRFK